jgi:hypothetical protein
VALQRSNAPAPAQPPSCSASRCSNSTARRCSVPRQLLRSFCLALGCSSVWSCSPRPVKRSVSPAPTFQLLLRRHLTLGLSSLPRCRAARRSPTSSRSGVEAQRSPTIFRFGAQSTVTLSHPWRSPVLAFIDSRALRSTRRSGPHLPLALRSLGVPWRSAPLVRSARKSTVVSCSGALGGPTHVRPLPALGHISSRHSSMLDCSRTPALDHSIGLWPHLSPVAVRRL